MTGAAPPPMGPSDWRFLGSLALLKLLVHLPVLGRYGYHHDELYFLACGQRLAWGYVDHPPLVPWIARMADALFGQSLYGLRIWSVLAGAVAVFLTGLLARRLGGGRFAQLAACLAMVVAPVYLRPGNMLDLPAFEPLFWAAGFYLVVRVLQEDRRRLWLGVGLVTGIGLLNKHSMSFFGVGLVVALLLTPQRRQLRSPWLYAGGAVAALVFLPNLLWQMANGWPTLEFLRQLNRETMAGIPLPLFLLGQVLYLNPVTAPLWIAGLFFFFSRAGRPYRVLGWMYVSVLTLLVLAGSKIYYLAPAYPALLAGGGVAFERLAAGRGWRWLRPATAGVLALGGLVLAPISLPVLSLGATERYIQTLTFGAFENVYEMTGDLRGQFGWRDRARIVAEVYNGLPADERRRTVVLGSWYGMAGAIDYFGKDLGLPPAVSGHMSYHLWGLPDGPITTVVTAGVPRPRLEAYCGEIQDAATVTLENVNPWERDFYVAICRDLKVDLRKAWPGLRDW